MPAKIKMKKIKSLRELRQLAAKDENYDKLMRIAAENLGGESGAGSERSYQWLETNAAETSEKGVVDEVNFCIGFV